MNKPNFKIVGTPIPRLNMVEPCTVECPHFGNYGLSNFTNYVSFGVHEPTGLIMIERRPYNGTNFWLVKEKDIEAAWLLEHPEYKSELESTSPIPTKWCIRRSVGTSQILNQWSNVTHGDNLRAITNNDYIYSDQKCTGQLLKGYTEITFEEFTKHILKKSFRYYVVMVDELYGHNGVKFKKDERIDIVNASLPYFEKLGLTKDPSILRPVFNIEEQNVSMNGKFTLRVNAKGIFHGHENITTYVEKLVDHFKSIKLEGYDVVIKNIVFEKTGCEKQETTLENWQNVYNLYLSLK